jgi:hypothetical protein
LPICQRLTASYSPSKFAPRTSFSAHNTHATQLFFPATRIKKNSVLFGVTRLCNFFAYSRPQTTAQKMLLAVAQRWFCIVFRLIHLDATFSKENYTAAAIREFLNIKVHQSKARRCSLFYKLTLMVDYLIPHPFERRVNIPVHLLLQ